MGDMFLHSIDEILKELPDVFGIAVETLVVEYDTDGRNHARTLR